MFIYVPFFVRDHDVMVGVTLIRISFNLRLHPAQTRIYAHYCMLLLPFLKEFLSVFCIISGGPWIQKELDTQGEALNGGAICEGMVRFVTILIFFTSFFAYFERLLVDIFGHMGEIRIQQSCDFAPDIHQYFSPSQRQNPIPVACGPRPGGASLDTSGKLQHPGGALQGRTA